MVGPPKAQPVDSYGPPKAKPVNTYGTPQAPPLDTYGPPKSQPISDNYGVQPFGEEQYQGSIGFVPTAPRNNFEETISSELHPEADFEFNIEDNFPLIDKSDKEDYEIEYEDDVKPFKQHAPPLGAPQNPVPVETKPNFPLVFQPSEPTRTVPRPNEPYDSGTPKYSVPSYSVPEIPKPDPELPKSEVYNPEDVIPVTPKGNLKMFTFLK